MGYQAHDELLSRDVAVKELIWCLMSGLRPAGGDLCG